MNDITKRIDWKFAIISFIVIFALQLFFALRGLFLLGGITFAVYPIVSLVCTTRIEWKELGIRKLEKWSPVFIGGIVSGIILALSYVINGSSLFSVENAININ